ncbi:NAD(+) synthase [Oryzicola mucosus]|uniref:NH(3)-dependent NAD(+) synthetase n=1 Tax=Oryzicola mucosus TaxID=2767425 RepID=A0A8J6U1V4_9HYPH|nr:NAD(+) synthase [Oryzicola mucosus]MBD0414943.1 NAD(+) synthase [Oryzicola mucosus]
MNTHAKPFSPETLVIDAEAEVERITAEMRNLLRTQLKRRGFVLGISGGIDSSVSAALAAKAVGSKNVFAVFTPENDSDPLSHRLGKAVADTFGIEAKLEDIGPALKAFGCYERRDASIREIVPEYGEGWASKVVIANSLSGDGFSISQLVVQDPEGNQRTVRMTPSAYLGVVAATNMKQRARKQIEYYHADRLNFAVIGTPNRLEYDQGFFVKGGDGLADIKPIAHLYKSQVYQLAEYLGVPEEVRRRPPTTDTYSLPQSQEEFYFSLPYDKMDLCLYGLNNGLSADAVASAAGLTAEQVGFVWTDIAAKRKTTRYLHLGPQLIEPVSEISH